MDQFGRTISNLVKEQFPEYYREHGPLFVTFVQEYYRWLETQTDTRDDWFVDKVSLVAVANRSANVVGRGTFFTTQFEGGDDIAISKGSETTDYEMFTVRSVANDAFLTLTSEKVPTFTHANTRYATVSTKPNALFLTRNFPELHDIDETLDSFVLYFKEKYLKNIQFKTITDTKTLVKHSLDLYRSKGTERSIDLLYKIAFGSPASLYYPGQDIFRLSSGIWFIPRYLELAIGPDNKKLINKEVTGVTSGAKAFVEEVIRRVMGGRIIDVAYISAINGTFMTGENLTIADRSVLAGFEPTIVGSLNEVEMDVLGSGLGFADNELVDITSVNGRGAAGKVLSTSNSSGQLTFSFADGGYGYSTNTQVSNTTGNVSVSTACTVVTGTGTLFQTEYTNGDSISLWSNSSAYTTRVITGIASNTSLTINATAGFTNATTKAGYTRSFAQTFVSEKILKISNATFTAGYSNFEYAPFYGTVTQPVALINYENANGEFTEGANIYTWSAGVNIGVGRVLTASRKTSTSGLLTISILSGDMNEPAIYTLANAVAANLEVSNGYYDMTATARYIGNYANVVISTTSPTGEFTTGEIIHQDSTGAIGTVSGSVVISNTETAVTVDNSQGIFKNGFNVQGANSGTIATVSGTEIEIGVVGVVNAFSVLSNNYIYTSSFQGTLTAVSLGSGAELTFSNTLLYTEQISFATDYIYTYLPLFLGAGSWGLPANTSANLSASIGTSLTTANLTIGKTESIMATTPGTDYTKIPIVRLHEPTIFSFSLPDTVVLTVSNTAGFNDGEIISQTAINSRGMIKEINSDTEITVQNMRFYSNNGFIASNSTPTTLVTGADSGYSANIVTVTPSTQSKRLGSDVGIDFSLVIGEGAVTAVKVTDSGFAFTDGEQVTLTSGDKNASGFAVLHTHGTGSGYYKSTDGFLSNVKKLSDGYYYQEYSYEVRSAVIDDFKKILKNVVHVSGTKYFDSLVYDTINTTDSDITTILTIT